MKRKATIKILLAVMKKIVQIAAANFHSGFQPLSFADLKVLTNEKRGGLRVISFDRSPFKLISRKFSKEYVQALSCERHKTTQQTLFLLFANNT